MPEAAHSRGDEGRWFSVRGPSITPRPPRGQPVVAALAHAGPAYRFAARAADVVFVTPRGPAHATKIQNEIKSFYSERKSPPAKVYADLTVVLDDQPGAAAARRAALDETAGREYVSDSAIVAGPPGALADLLLEWRAAGLDGFRLRPGVLPHDHEVARQFATLDHLSDGRAGWNVVTSPDAFTGQNFRRGGYLERGDRYVRAAEFVPTARQLWESWTPESGSDLFRIKNLNFDIAGTVTVPRSPQLHPVASFVLGDTPGDAAEERNLSIRDLIIEVNRRERGAFRAGYEEGTTLRDRLGLAAEWAAARAAGTEKASA